MNDQYTTGGMRSKKKGDIGEEQAHHLLVMMGARMLQKIATPIKIFPPKQKAARIAFFKRLKWTKKVKGDRWGIDAETGKSILAEVKYHTPDRFQYSVLKPHQVAALNEHAACKGLTYLVWVHPTDVFVLRWPIPEFESGTSISLERAGRLKIDRIGQMPVDPDCGCGSEHCARCSNYVYHLSKMDNP